MNKTLKIRGNNNQVAFKGDIFNLYVPNYSSYYKEVNKEISLKNIFSSKVLKVISEINKYDTTFNIEVLGSLLEINSLDELLVYFNTSKEPSFEFMDMVSKNIHISSSWLKYSNGNIFDIESIYCYPLSNFYEVILEKKPLNIYVILKEGKDMEIMLLLQIDKYKYQRYYKSIALYEVMGATGKSEIYELYKFFKKLNSNSLLYLNTYGLWLNDNIFNAIMSGKIYPGAIHKEKEGINYFYEDFLDIEHKYFDEDAYLKMYNKNFLIGQEIIRYYLKEKL